MRLIKQLFHFNNRVKETSVVVGPARGNRGSHFFLESSKMGSTTPKSRAKQQSIVETSSPLASTLFLHRERYSRAVAMHDHFPHQVFSDREVFRSRFLRKKNSDQVIALAGIRISKKNAIGCAHSPSGWASGFTDKRRGDYASDPDGMAVQSGPVLNHKANTNRLAGDRVQGKIVTRRHGRSLRLFVGGLRGDALRRFGA